MSRWTDKFSYWTGTLITPDLSAFLLGRDDLMEKRTPHTVLAVLDKDTWKAKSFPFTSIAVCWGEQPARELVLIGHEGDIAAGSVEELKREAGINIDGDAGKVGYLRCARSIAGRIYIGGMDRQIYRRIQGGWEALDNGMPGEESTVVGLEAIDGFSSDEIYAVGHEGEIWRFDGHCWHPAASPTNLILLGVHCAADGFVYACGQVGTVLRGRGDEWEVIANAATQEDFWDVISFKGVLYLATRDVLYALKDGELAPVDFGETNIPFSFYRFAASDEYLLTIGSKDVMRFDGNTWSRVD